MPIQFDEKKNPTRFKKTGKWEEKPNHIFSITVMIVYFPHVRHEKKKGQT